MKEQTEKEQTHSCTATPVDIGGTVAVCGGIPDIFPYEDELYLIADFFRVFGDPTRLSILLALDEAEMCVCDLAAKVGMSKSAISHQLSGLRSARLVTFRREGKHIFYRLADNHVRHIIECAMDHIREA